MSTEANLPEDFSQSVVPVSTIRAQDYRRHFRALLPTFMQEATHFTVDKYFVYKFMGHLEFIDCHLVFNYRSWNKLRYLTIRQPAGPSFLLELPTQLDELYVCSNHPNFHVLSPWNRCHRFIHDSYFICNPRLPHDIVCDEYLIRTTNYESLIELFNLGYGYVRTVSYTPPKRFALFEGPSTTHTRRSRAMELFVRYSTPPPSPLPTLNYHIVRKNGHLIKRCLMEMMRSWPENEEFYDDVCNMIEALNRIHSTSMCWGSDRKDIEKVESEFSELNMETDEGLKWQDRISSQLTCYTCYNYQSSDQDSDPDFSESSESEMSEEDSTDEFDKCSKKQFIYAKDIIPGYEHFPKPPPLYAKYYAG